MNPNDLRMTLKAALDNLWSRISGIFGTVNGRIDDIETDVSSVTSRVEGVETRMTTAEGQITELDNRVDDLEGDTIKSITFNGTVVPKDAQGNVALQETDPTVPAWAKQVKAKTSDFTNDGDGTDNNSPFATKKYVQDNGGKIDKIQVNSVDQPIVNKTVNLSIPKSIDDLADKPFVKFTESATQASICDVLDGMDDGSFLFFESWSVATEILLGKAIPSQYAFGDMEGTILCTQQEGSVKFYYLLARYSYYDNGEPPISESGVAISYLDVNEGVHETVHVYESSLIKDGGGGGGGGSGAVDTVTFNGIQHSPDASGDVSLNESDPTVPAWAKAASKPTYTAQEVGALSANTPIPSKTSDLTNDSGFLTSSTGVTGVKGNAESSYQTGNVNLTPANIGAVAKSGDTMTGNLIIVRESSNANIRVKTNATGVTLWMYNPTNGTHGIYSDGYYDGSAFNSSGKYLISRGNDGKVAVADHYDITQTDTAIAQAIEHIGTIVNGTVYDTLTVETSTFTAVASITLTQGTWIVLGYHAWTSSISAVCSIGFSTTASGSNIAGTHQRYQVGSGGGQQTMTIRQVASSETIYLRAWQNSGAVQTANAVFLQAIRIA